MEMDPGVIPESSHPGIYVHVPFCSVICPYCDFAVRTGGKEKRKRFVDHLLAEMDLYCDQSPYDQPADTIYFGGGTPSVLLPEDLSRILAGLERSFPLAPNPRLFFEVNPEDVTETSLSAWRDLGISTLSLGAQSLETERLRFLGRKHDRDEALASIQAAIEKGFSTVSVDLIYGCPGETLESWEKTLSEVMALGPHHLSCYQLTIHEGTPFGKKQERGELVEVGEGGMASFFERTHLGLSAAGCPGYEVSNFATRPEHQSRHNMKYWNHTPYVGLGPSAHSFDGVHRWWNERDLSDYERMVDKGQLPIAGREKLSKRDRAFECLMLRLRTPGGVDLPAFEANHSVDLVSLNHDLFESWIREGQVLRADSWLRPTVRGLMIADFLARSIRFENV